jgi:hypothetical protein
VPPIDVDELEFSMPESVALLYMPVTPHHTFLEGQRDSGWLEDDLDLFDPPMD